MVLDIATFNDSNVDASGPNGAVTLKLLGVATDPANTDPAIDQKIATYQVVQTNFSYNDNGTVSFDTSETSRIADDVGNQLGANLASGSFLVQIPVPTDQTPPEIVSATLKIDGVAGTEITTAGAHTVTLELTVKDASA